MGNYLSILTPGWWAMARSIRYAVECLRPCTWGESWCPSIDMLCTIPPRVNNLPIFRRLPITTSDHLSHLSTKCCPRYHHLPHLQFKFQMLPPIVSYFFECFPNIFCIYYMYGTVSCSQFQTKLHDAFPVWCSRVWISWFFMVGHLGIADWPHPLRACQLHCNVYGCCDAMPHLQW